MRYVFGDYILDMQRYELRRAGQRVPLEPKAFDLLAYLVKHRDRVVRRTELLEQVWPEQFLSDHSLTARLQAVRQALGEDARQPQCIETVHGRGYRFIASLTSAPASDVVRESHQHAVFYDRPELTASDAMVGRESDMAFLHCCLDRVRTGRRQVVFVSGEAGLGKTTLVDAFIQEADRQGALAIGRGQCIEHYGRGEAYMPVLQALEQVCRLPDGPEVIDCLTRQAPTWMVQMPWLLPAADLDRLQRTTLGATPQRMLREMARALEVITTEMPLVLVLEDLHWSDYASLDLLAMLARRQQAAKLLVLGTYRPEEIIGQEHPLHTMTQELYVHGHGKGLPLTLLPQAEVKIYLTRRWPKIPHLDELTRFFYRRTEGHPLFMVTMIDGIITKEIMEEPEGSPTLLRRLEEAESGVPVSLRQLLEQRLDRLPSEKQRLLEIGSIIGSNFAVAAVAAVWKAEVEQVETWCEGLVRRQQWLQARGQETWPDGTVSGRYGFIHALYRDVVYSRVPVARRLRLHRQIGEHLESAYGDLAGRLAAELAVHFEQGQAYQRAVRYRRLSAEQASQRCAYQEAVMHLRQGLAGLETLPQTPERTRHELGLLAILATVLRNTKGQADPEVKEKYVRVHALCQQVENAPQLFFALRGLWNYYNSRAELRTADELGEQIFSLAQRQNDPTFRVWGHYVMGMRDQYSRGAFAAARAHFEHALAHYDRQQHRALALLHGFDPGMGALAFLAWTSWLLGYPDQALRQSRQALALARELGHPYSLAAVLNWSVLLYQFRREWAVVRERVEALLALACEYGLTQRVAWGTLLQGRVLVEDGQEAEGIGQIRQGLSMLRTAGQELWRPYNLALLAEAYGKIGQIDAGRRTLEEALVLVEQSGDCLWESELYRLKGEFLRRQATPDDQLAERSFQQALDLARRRHAKSLELRAAMSLSRLWQQQGKRQAAYELLASLHGWFSEGLETVDMQEAKVLLGTLAKQS